MDVLIVECGEGQFGLRISDVREILPAVMVRPLPNAPPIIDGVIDRRGRAIPVVNVRLRFGMPRRPVSPREFFVIAVVGARTVGLRVDRAVEVITVDSVEPMTAVSLHTPHIAGIVGGPDGLVLLNDLAAFLSDTEQADLSAALTAADADADATTEIGVLRRRAKALAAGVTADGAEVGVDMAEADPTMDVVAFSWASQPMAVAASVVVEVFRPPPLVRMPGLSGVWIGVTNWRGHIVAVVDLAPLLELPTPSPRPSVEWIVGVGDGGGEIEFGIAAEVVDEVAHLPSAVWPKPPHAVPIVAGLLPGGRLLLDADALMADSRLWVAEHYRTEKSL